ncbi:MAG: AAA family ATPase [Chitinophagaceae bacterium]|nr:AAA family ATPase [Chitinophagaceae bacterium]
MTNKNLPPKKVSPAKQKKYDYLVTGEEMLLQPITQLPCLWEPYFPQQGLILLSGASDVGKTSFLRQFAIANVLKENSFLGSPLHVRHGRALYLTTEDSKISMQFALQKSIDTARVKPSQLQELCYLINPANPYSAIEEQLKVAKTDLIIVDSFADVFRGNLNDNTAVRTFLDKYQRLSEKYDTLFIFLHHTGKRTENGNASKNNVIGSQGIEAKMRLVMEMKKPDNSNRRDLYFTKGNYLPESLKSQAMQLNFDSKQQFQLIGSSPVSNSNSSSRFFSKEEKDKIMKIAEPLKKQDISFDNIRTELSKMGLPKVPSKGKLVEWFSDSDLSQSA